MEVFRWPESGWVVLGYVFYLVDDVYGGLFVCFHIWYLYFCLYTFDPCG